MGADEERGGLFDFDYPSDGNRPILPGWGRVTHERVRALHTRIQLVEAELARLRQVLGEEYARNLTGAEGLDQQGAEPNA